ncbi:MAG: hypothetical protein K2H20_03910 [Bacilli bacterium]|nr:hypothetical protein [Bacilli bacterium]
MEDKDLIETEGKGWYSNILNGISKAFNSFVTVFKKHGFVYSLAVFCLFALLYCLIINPINIDKIVQERFHIEKQIEKEETEKSIQRRMEANSIVSEIMLKLTYKYNDNVNRCLLIEMHNSMANLQGIHFIYGSCTYECLSPSSRHFTYISNDLQRQQVMNLFGQNLIQTMKYRNYVYFDDIKTINHPEIRIVHKLAETEDNECLIVPFLNNYNYPTLVMIICGNNLPVDNIMDYIEDFRKQIENCLM